MTLHKKGVPKDFEIDRGLFHKKELYLPVSEIVKALKFYKGLKGDALAKLFKGHKINKSRKQS